MPCQVVQRGETYDLSTKQTEESYCYLPIHYGEGSPANMRVSALCLSKRARFICKKGEIVMRRSMLIALTLIITAACTASADAGWNEFWHRAHLDYHRMACWPEPFIHADRDILQEHYAVYERMGWQRQNTLGEHHFHAETNKINSAGTEKLMHVLTQTPPQRRTLFVLQGVDQNITATRVDSVQRAAAALFPEGDLPSVVQTHVPPVMRPGDQIDHMDREYKSNQPVPKLPAMQAAGGI